MTFWERVLEFAITVVLIVGGYQFYFWAQRQTWVTARSLETRWDAKIKYDPRWVWIYSGLYYPMIVAAGLAQPDWSAFAHAVGCYLMLLAIQVVFFLVWPVAIPQSWRTSSRREWELEHGIDTWSQRFLDFVWSIDKLRNGCPSMHVSVAMVTDLMIARRSPFWGVVGLAFPILIAWSALKTKQHFVADVVPGAVLGALVYASWAVLQ